MRHPANRKRTGTALLIALVLLALVSALLPGAAAAARATQRSEFSSESSSQIQAAWRRAAASALATWNPAADHLGLGGQLSNTEQTGNVRTTTTTTRLTARMFAVDLEVTLAPDSLLIARRRIRVLVSRATSTDSISVATPPKLSAQWAIADIY